MRPIETTMQVDAAPDDVFDFMADVGNETRWNPDVRTVRRLDGGALGAGARWEASYRGLGPMQVRLDGYERPSHLAFSTIGPRMDMRFTFDHVAAGSGTLVTVHAEVTPKGALRLVAPMLGPMMRRTFAQRPAQLSAGIRAWRSTRA